MGVGSYLFVTLLCKCAISDKNLYLTQLFVSLPTGVGSVDRRVRGGGMCEKDGREDKKWATAARRCHRSAAVRFVGTDGHSKRCPTVWSWLRHSGQLAVGAAPMRAWYKQRWEQNPDLSWERVVLVTWGRDFSPWIDGWGGCKEDLAGWCGGEVRLHC